MITRSKKMGDLQEIRNILDEIRIKLTQSEADKKVSDEKIDLVLEKLKERDEKIELLSDKIIQLEKNNELLTRKIDDNESYQRRFCLRVYGIPEPEVNDTEEQCIQSVKEEISKLETGIPNPDSIIDRAHRIGKKSKLTSRPIIIRFTTFRARTAVYRARDKRKEAKIKFTTDITKRRLTLRNHASNLVKGNDLVDFVFSDINNNICMRLKSGALKFFNSEAELDKVLAELPH